MTKDETEEYSSFPLLLSYLFLVGLLRKFCILLVTHLGHGLEEVGVSLVQQF